MSNVAYRFFETDYVQYFLDNLEPMQKFVVIFMKKDGEQRKLVGCLDPNGKEKKDNVAVMTDDGWKSFNINRVMYLDVHSV